MENREYVELRSEDVQEILGTPPGWLVRWGTTVVLIGFVLLLGAAYFVRYPDLVDGRIIITTSIPPVEVVARSDGRIEKLFVAEGGVVADNQRLAVLHSTANFRHVLTLDSLVNRWLRYNADELRQVSPPSYFNLGELESVYADFTGNLDLYKFGKSAKTASTSSNIVSIQQQIRQLDQSIDFDRKALRRVQDQYGPAEELYKEQKKLFDEKIISKSDFERERAKVAELERQRDQYQEDIIRKQNEIIGLRRSITDASINREESETTVGARLHNSLNVLRGNLDKWAQSYVLTAPMAGTVSLNTSYFSDQQFVKQGETVMTIVPKQNTGLVGRMMLPVTKSGKVRKDLPVIIKLDNFQYNEFGSIRGLVRTKSLVPKDDMYAITIEIQDIHGNNISTSYHKQIPFEQQLQGKAEIITEDKGLLERIGEQLFARIR